MSVIQAAGELNVTPVAVSLPIKDLEAALGIAQFVRRPRSLVDGVLLAPMAGSVASELT